MAKKKEIEGIEETDESEEPEAETKKGSVFLKVLREQLLQPRFDALIEYGEDYVKQNFDGISQRMLWYNCVKIYKQQTGSEEPDIAGKGLDHYMAFLKAIESFCSGKKNVAKASEVNSKFGEYWGILRKALNIDAKGRAVCYGAAGDNIMVVPANKERYLNSGLFAVICEKDTFGLKWLEEMNRRGWNDMFLLIITQGFSSCEVIETLMEIRESIQSGQTNFHVGILHDCDIAGITIKDDVHQHFPVMDFGINFEMLDAVNPTLWDSLKEVKKTSAKQKQILINAGHQAELDRLGDYRLELDNLYVTQGVGIYCDYAEKILNANCSVWDLNRLSKPSVSNPSRYNTMQARVENLWDKIVVAATGLRPYKINWTQCATAKYNEFLRENRNYNANVSTIKEYKTHINEQSDKLQEIIEKDPQNVEKINAIAELYDLLNLDKIEEQIKNGKTEEETEDSEDSDNVDDGTCDDNCPDDTCVYCDAKSDCHCDNCGDGMCYKHANQTEESRYLCDDCLEEEENEQEGLDDDEDDEEDDDNN